MEKKNKKLPLAPMSQDYSLEDAAQGEVGNEEVQVKKKSVSVLDDGSEPGYAQGRPLSEPEDSKKLMQKQQQKAQQYPGDKDEQRYASEASALYQKHLKAAKGHVPSAYMRAKQAGDKASAAKFMQLMKKTAKGKVRP